MTVKTNDLPTNNLNINEIEQNTPPNSLELGSGKEGESNDFPVNFYIIKLVSRLLEMADEDYSLLSPIDRETLRDVLACGSIEKVAKKQHKSISLIRMRLKSAIDTLDSLFRSWQDPHQMLMEMNLRVQKLENDIEERDRIILAQNERIEHQKNEIISLKSRLKGQTGSYLKPEEMKDRARVSDTMRWKLGGRLESEKIPLNLVEKLNRHSIYTIYDLVRYREKAVSNVSISTLIPMYSGLRNTRITTSIKSKEHKAPMIRDIAIYVLIFALGMLAGYLLKVVMVNKKRIKNN